MPLAAARFLDTVPMVSAAHPSVDAEDPEVSGALPPVVYWGIGMFAALSLLTPNGLLTAASLAVLGLLIYLLWRPGEPPVMLFAIGYQWVQVTAKVFHANVFGVYVEALSASPSIVPATWLSLVGLVVLAVGMHIGLRRLPTFTDKINQGLAGVSVQKAFWLYVFLAIYAGVIGPIGWAFGPLTQILLSTASVKWAGFFILAYLALSRREGLGLLALAFLFEVVSGIGYFAGFKTVFFVFLLAALATRPRITPGTVANVLVIGVVLVLMGSAWSVVKPSFRAEISGGGQGSSLSQGDQVSSLYNALADLGPSDLVDGLDPLFRRLSYTEYFALTMDYVPSEVPHERGALWGLAVKHALQPRLFFPDKPRLLSDSEVTMQYTGQRLASDSEGTSISIGYMGEAYIDFGPVRMFGLVLALGLMWGLMFAYFVRRARVPLLGLSMSMAVLLRAYQFEMASIKIFGGVLMAFLVLALLFYLFENRLAAWLGAEITPPPEAEAERELDPPVGLGGLVRI